MSIKFDIHKSFQKFGNDFSVSVNLRHFTINFLWNLKSQAF